MNRIEATFKDLKQQNRPALITYIMAYDPDLATSQEILNGLPEAGADIVELGMPFSDPMADGPTIEEAGIRALKAGAKVSGIVEMVRSFRKNNNETPIVLMGYYNPIQNYGLERFAKEAGNAGVDGLLIVDLPPEEDEELYNITKANGINLIKLASPTSNDERLKLISKKASGFLYYVAVAGVTGAKSASYDSIGDAVFRIKKHTDIPVAVGFGIKTAEDVKAVGKHADAVVVGSALVNKIAESGSKKALEFVTELKVE